jgi:hypothetical protein
MRDMDLSKFHLMWKKYTWPVSIPDPSSDDQPDCPASMYQNFTPQARKDILRARNSNVL